MAAEQEAIVSYGLGQIQALCIRPLKWPHKYEMLSRLLGGIWLVASKAADDSGCLC